MAISNTAAFFTASCGGGAAPDWLSGIVLPLGISFYTFEQIAYLVDVRSGRTKPARLDALAFFVLFFPHLIAGPIIRYSALYRQYVSPPRRRGYLGASFGIGMILFAIGLSKKVVIADSLAPFVDTISAAAKARNGLSTSDAWIAMLGYTLQLYFDFSGYSDMAIGLARMFGIRLPLNFNSPYKAKGFIEFWQRWHITLSRFFRDYLYLPLGGNRKGLRRQICNIAIVFVLTGLWHGAGWTFIVWGCLHGAAVLTNHLWRRFRKRDPDSLINRIPVPARDVAARIATILCVALLWVLFRADSLQSASRIWGRLIGIKSYNYALDDPKYYTLMWSLIAVFGAMALIGPSSQDIVRWIRRQSLNHPLLASATAAVAAILFYFSIATIGMSPTTFIYFNF